MKRLVILLILFSTNFIQARPFTPEEMAKCKSVVVIAGTYDPFTYGHENMGHAIRKDLPFDCVLYLPTPETPHKIASPYATRYDMLEAALKDQEGLFYPSREDLSIKPKEYMKKIRDLSQDKKVFAALGSDLSDKNFMYFINEYRLDPDGYIITGRGEEVKVAKAFKNKPYHVIHPQSTVSSTKVRTWFAERPETYFKEGLKASDFPHEILREDVSRYIVKNGLYLGSDGITTRTPARIVKTAFTSGLNKVGLYHPLREVMVKKHKQDLLTEIEIEGKKYPLKKHLGSGLTADAYIFNYDGQDMVVKIANQRPKSAFSIQQDVLIGKWLNDKTSIKVPDVHFVDPEGKFKVATKVGGESLGEYLKRVNGAIEPAVELQLRKAVDDMLEMSRVTNIKLDLSVDNLKIWNDKVYLIDAGPIPPDVSHPMSYEEFSKKWGSHVKVTIRPPNCKNALKGLLLDFTR